MYHINFLIYPKMQPMSRIIFCNISFFSFFVLSFVVYYNKTTFNQRFFSRFNFSTPTRRKVIKIDKQVNYLPVPSLSPTQFITDKLFTCPLFIPDITNCYLSSAQRNLCLSPFWDDLYFVTVPCLDEQGKREV